MNVPFNTKATAWLIRRILRLFEFEFFALVATNGSPYHFVLMQGDPRIAIVGLSSMVASLADETGRSRQDIINLVTKHLPN